MHLYHTRPRKNSLPRGISRFLRTYKTAIWIITLIILFFGIMKLYNLYQEPYTMQRSSRFVVGLDNKKYTYDRNDHLIFIGGVPRSGWQSFNLYLNSQGL